MSVEERNYVRAKEGEQVQKTTRTYTDFLIRKARGWVDGLGGGIYADMRYKSILLE